MFSGIFVKAGESSPSNNAGGAGSTPPSPTPASTSGGTAAQIMVATPTGVWLPMSSSNAPEARFMHSSIWTGNEMIIWGGYGANQSSNFAGGARYIPSSNSWAAISNSNAPTARSHHTAIWNGSKMIVWGGNGPTGPLNSGAIFDPLENSWVSTETQDAPSIRHLNSLIWTDEKMITWGGEATFSGGGGQLNDGALFSF